MMIQKTRLLLAVAILLGGTASAQIGIGTTTPNASAALDVSSTSKGLLIPRLTTAQRDAIVAPATGLMIYNTDHSVMEINNGVALPDWAGLQSSTSSAINSVTVIGDTTTNSATDVLVPGMTSSPLAGTYLVMFNGQYGVAASTVITTSQAVADLNTAYNQITALPATNTTHGAILGGNPLVAETLLPGVYTFAAAVSASDTLILDGGGDPNALFVFRIGGAFNTGAGTIVKLTNGASAKNIFWVVTGAIGLAAGTVMKGTLIASSAAVAVAATSNVEGRLFSTAGAVSFGPGTAVVPTGTSSLINLGVLSSFVMFTNAGAVGNTGSSAIIGDIGSNLGAITGFAGLNGNIYTPSGAITTARNTLATFSVYQNGVQIAGSARSAYINSTVIPLQAIATITTGQTIEVRWKVDQGPVLVGNRILTLVKIN